MRLSDAERNPAAVEQGEWVENIPQMADLRLRVRGIQNSDWRRIQSKLIDALPPAKREGGRIDPDEVDRINGILLQSACLLDWSGLTDDGDRPIPYSRELAAELITDPKYRAFREAVLWAATVVGERRAARVEETAKN